VIARNRGISVSSLSTNNDTAAFASRGSVNRVGLDDLCFLQCGRLWVGQRGQEEGARRRMGQNSLGNTRRNSRKDTEEEANTSTQEPQLPDHTIPGLVPLLTFY
jgi:hypothetical protein